MTVCLNTKSTNTYFNILAPVNLSGQDEALFIGDAGGSRYEGVLPMMGDHIIQAYLYRNAVRRDESANFMLDVDTAAAGGSGGANAGIAKVAQRNSMRWAGSPAHALLDGHWRPANWGSFLWAMVMARLRSSGQMAANVW